MDFARLFAAYRWSEIRNCPGRYMLRGAASDLHPRRLLGEAMVVRRYRVAAARDAVWVAQFEGGGLLSYERADGSFFHTLNTPDGLARKLAQLGIAPDEGAQDE